MTTVAPPFSFADFVIGGSDYRHPALGSAGRFGRIIEIKAAGANRTAPEYLMPGNKNILIADVLRPPLMLEAAGAVVIDEVDPSYTTLGTIDNLEARWLVGDQSVQAEEVSTSAATIGDSICIARVEFSRRFKLQSPTAETLLKVSMQRAMRAALEKAGIAGTGGYEPKGLINDTAIHLETGALSAAALVDDAQQLVITGCDPLLVSIIASAHDMAAMLSDGVTNEGRVTTGALHNLKGFGVRFSPYLASGEAMVGQFNQLNVVFYEEPQIIVDPYTEGAQGKTRISVFQGSSVVASQAKAFIRRRAA